jgi:hypothetical protein
MIQRTITSEMCILFDDVLLLLLFLLLGPGQTIFRHKICYKKSQHFLYFLLSTCLDG